MKTHEEKVEYLLKKWGYIEIERGLGIVPAFDSKGNSILGMIEKVPTGSVYCRNYSLKEGRFITREGKPFFGKIKEFGRGSVQEAVALAYRSERVGEQTDLFKEN